MIRRTVWFSGRVQGVGFRATAASLARGHAVAGYVRNLPDGRVELVMEGEPGDVEGLVSAVRERMGRQIRGVESSSGPATGEFGPASPGALGVRY